MPLCLWLTTTCSNLSSLWRKGSKYAPKDTISTKTAQPDFPRVCVHWLQLQEWATFYAGAGGSGRLTQADYVVILEGVIAPNWDANWTLFEDNDNSHGTRGNKDNKCKQAKRRLGIHCEANPPESPDLNPIETIWRTIKQRLKNRGLILDGTGLRRAIQEEWNNITLEEINRAIDSMSKRVAELNERNGLPIPF
jgi:DDE superfamily endonuclease